jgi:hypothetical protein
LSWALACGTGGTDGTGGSSDTNNKPGPDTCSSKSAVYIWVFGHHYLGGGGVYPRAQDLRDIVDVIDELEVLATLYFDGILMEELVKEDPGVFKTFVGNPLMAFGYHGEETHGPYPVPTSLNDPENDFTHLDPWDTAYDRTLEFATVARTYSFVDPDASIREIDRYEGGEYQPGESGGVALVKSLLGQSLSVATYHGILAPAVKQGFRSVGPVPLQQGTYPVVSHALGNNLPLELRSQLLALGGDHDLFYHMGVPTTKARPESELPHGVTPLKKALGDLNRSRPRLVMYRLNGEPGDMSAMRADLKYLMEEFLPANPNSRIVSPLDLVDLLEPPLSEPVPKAAIGAIAATLVEAFKEGQPPDMVTTDDATYSLADSFELLARTLVVYATTGSVPDTVKSTGLLGPMGDGAALSHCGDRTLTVQDIINAATATLLEVEETVTDRRPRRIPYVIDVADQACNPAELLRSMAESVHILMAGGTPATEAKVLKVDMVPPYGDALDTILDVPPRSNSLWLGKLQLWTVQPAPFRCN